MSNRYPFKYSYAGNKWYKLVYAVNILCILICTWGFIRFFDESIYYWIFIGPLVFIVVINSLIGWSINLFSRKFDVKVHKEKVDKFKKAIKGKEPWVDIYLPVCGEPLAVLKNTWEGVKELNYPKVKIYLLDDKGDEHVRDMAGDFGFKYLSRPNKGEMKKSGNLRYGFENSDSEFSMILDADFRPFPEYIYDLLGYMYEDSKNAIVQSPQVFELSRDLEKRSPLEFGAAHIQQYFYKIIQGARSKLGGAICVGSCALYRRKALAELGGTVLKSHSEDIWNGFSLVARGWKIKYVPVHLSKGLCPDDFIAYYKQQTRWCQASVLMIMSKEFWKARVPLYTKLCYVSGFTYYVSTPSYLLLPFLSFFILWEDYKYINWQNGLFFTPSLIAYLLTWSFVECPKPRFGTILAQMYAYWIYAFTVISGISSVLLKLKDFQLVI